MTKVLLPFSRSEGLFSLNALRVIGPDGQPILAQFETLSRWGGAPSDCSLPIRFAYAHVMAVPPPGQQASWQLTASGGSSASIGLRVIESPSEIFVDTNKALFTISKSSFVGLSSVAIANAGGEEKVVSYSTGSNFVIEQGGRKTLGTPREITLERRGPTTATLKARGYYVDASGQEGLGYTIRLHFYAGSGTVLVEHTYYYQDVAGGSVEGLTNRTQIERAFLRVPLVGTPTGVSLRAAQNIHNATPTLAVSLRQQKRSPSTPLALYVARSGGQILEQGSWANNPYLAATNNEFGIAATVARMDVRDPQGLSWNPSANELEVEFTSEPMFVGGARGIWSVAAINFDQQSAISGGTFDALKLHAERPLLGRPGTAYLNQTRTIGPYVEPQVTRYNSVFNFLDGMHNRTASYFKAYGITGLQIWPDMPRLSCYSQFDCAQSGGQYFEGGDNNYWNWSKAGFDEFFRTGDNRYVYDFSLGETRTYAETFSVRTGPDKITSSFVTGLAPCYGSSRGYAGDYREGLNNRRDSCSADYTYSKSLKHAYLATADRRFVDFFEEAGQGVVNVFRDAPTRTGLFNEISLFRMGEQRLEILSDSAEFSDSSFGQEHRAKLNDYVTKMLQRVLIDGHTCDTEGTGYNDATQLGTCKGSIGWMLPVSAEWVRRTAQYLGRSDLMTWLQRHAQVSIEQHTVLDGLGQPDWAQRNGWAASYRCNISASGVDESTCSKTTTGENGGRFYPGGLQAYLNVFGIILGADPSDPNDLCAWLPATYLAQFENLADTDHNYQTWGKESGQIFALSPEALGALANCAN